VSAVWFVSGWAGFPELFPRLARSSTFLVPFVDGDEAALSARLADAGGDVLLGWSTGAHLLLKSGSWLFPRFSLVLLAAPFLRFSDSLPGRVLDAMRAGLELDAESTLSDFYRTCDAPPPAFRVESTARLAEGLEYLGRSVAPGTTLPAGNVLVVHGSADRVVRARAVRQVMDALEGARYVSMPCGHFIAEEHLARLAHETENWRLF